MEAEEEADLVFLQGDLAAQFGNGGGGGGQRGLGGGGFQFGGDAAAEAVAENAQALAKGVGGLLGDGQLFVQGEQLEVRLGDAGDEADQDVAAGFLGGEELGAGGFVEAADAAPKINFPGDVAGEVVAFAGGGAGVIGRIGQNIALRRRRRPGS